MSITYRELASAASTAGFTRNFRHLLPVPRFLVRGPFMPGQPVPKDTKLKDRIKYWNIVPGDFVKLRGDTNGTLHEVHKVNKLSNRVILKREINKAGYVPDARSQTGLSVPYAQCQLLVGKYEYPPEDDSTEPTLKNVFASRLTMSKPYYYRKGGFWIWRRYAVNTIPRLPNYTDWTHVSIRIPWPKRNAITRPDPTPYDTTEDDALAVTYTPPSLPATFLSPAPRIPTEQEYINFLYKAGKPRIRPSDPIEVHVHKELSNPHGRAKKQARWQAFQARQKALLQEYIDAEYANLAGRTKKEARAEATWKWQQRLADDRKAELTRRWRNRGEEASLKRKMQRKQRKAIRRSQKLRNLVLEEAKNQIVPQAA
ncbi:hypothetical protein BD309DRAFT_963789 [Dichomitus squalens]|uniref:Uncharacterized protein n=1 Tax=Dichomitus squalens TaxID=114155 RepID=A0A4Q9NMC3_9APHY|nr:hypothetical protein BD309DRAFT_963789 [Dichomitus squalens]TBU61367.1 hypothetical protein BD310DRAFT_921304 [Dichomitus squalens]